MINNISDLKKDECFGCRACEQICPKKCISMSDDEEGFLYPFVEEKECIDCGICIKHCPAKQNLIERTPIRFLGVRLKDKSTLLESTSGGLFAGVAEYIINNNGVVFGCAFDESLRARHIKAETLEELKNIKKSKYVSSNLLNTYKEVADILKSEPERFLLYTGTPCQIHGLYSYLGNKPNKLFTIDIVCHGVPSQKLFDKYIEWLNNNLGERIIYYGFRDKDIDGWTCNGKSISKNKIKKINGAVDPYYSAFMRGETYRLSCYKCPFSNLKHRPADITMGDFWGIEFTQPSFYSKNGVSCCIINTEKGSALLEQVSSKFEQIETTAECIIKMNINLKQPTEKPFVRDSIYKEIDEIPSIQFIPRLYAPIYKRIIRFIISKVPHSIKTSIKKNLNRLFK